MSNSNTLPQPEPILEGSWEEIAQQADRLAGRRVRLTLLPLEPAETEQTPFHAFASPSEWVEAFEAWAHGHAPRSTPMHSDEAIGRETIYGAQRRYLIRQCRLVEPASDPVPIAAIVPE